MKHMRIRGMEENIKGFNKSVIGISGKVIFEEIKAENCSELIQDRKPDSGSSVNSKKT